MKKFYDSADLCAIVTRSEYINSDNSIIYNVFVPIGLNNNDETTQTMKYIKSEIKKISDKDIKNNNLNALAPSFLNSQLYCTKFMNFQNPEHLIVNFRI